jgi:hypothetical protein
VQEVSGNGLLKRRVSDTRLPKGHTRTIIAPGEAQLCEENFPPVFEPAPGELAWERRVAIYREKIAEQYHRLGRNQKRIADFVTKEYREAAFMNGSALAAHLEVDPATVTRFAQRLGYTGYPDLLEEIQGLVKEELRAAYG